MPPGPGQERPEQAGTLPAYDLACASSEASKKVNGMNGIQVQKNGKGYNLHCQGAPKGLPVPPGMAVRFPHGIPGFERVTDWRFTANVDVYPFLHLSATDESVRFVCIDTFRVCADFQLALPSLYSEPLEIGPASRVAILSIVTVGRRPQDTTANLMSPLLVNLDTRHGEQIILETTSYPLKLRIWETLRLGETRDESEDRLLAAMA